MTLSRAVDRPIWWINNSAEQRLARNASDRQPGILLCVRLLQWVVGVVIW